MTLRAGTDCSIAREDYLGRLDGIACGEFGAVGDGFHGPITSIAHKLVVSAKDNGAGSGTPLRFRDMKSKMIIIS